MQEQTGEARPLAVSIGEPAGIGPDVLLMACVAARRGRIAPLPPLTVLCDPAHLLKRAARLGISDPLTLFDTVTLSKPFHAQAGRPDARDGKGVVEAISRAVDMVRGGRARALVTMPIQKKSLYDAGFTFPGHTEYLADAALRWPGVEAPVRSVMMLAGPELRAVPVTIHIPLAQVPASLTTSSIVETGRIVADELRRRFRIAGPRLALSGLNPHAGEEGAMGTEDRDVIAPAVAILRAQGIAVAGPLPADTMFHAAARRTYDAALCMYHDQALIPAKALAFDETVNVTLGLPFVRTSPDHGTALDIAGTGKARPDSTIAAIRMAHEMTRHDAARVAP